MRVVVDPPPRLGDADAGEMLALATLTDDGTKKVLTLGLERGPKGDKGDKGDRGDKGATGATGPQGPKGPAGVTFTLSGTVLYITTT